MSRIAGALLGPLGPYIAGAAGAVLLGAVALASVQTWRAGNLSEDLRAARSALRNPETGKTWESEARRDAASLKTCHGNVGRLDQALNAANASIGRLEEEARAASVANRARQRAAQRASADARHQAAEIMARPPSGDLCASALDILRGP